MCTSCVDDGQTNERSSVHVHTKYVSSTSPVTLPDTAGTNTTATGSPGVPQLTAPVRQQSEVPLAEQPLPATSLTRLECPESPSLDHVDELTNIPTSQALDRVSSPRRRSSRERQSRETYDAATGKSVHPKGVEPSL